MSFNNKLKQHSTAVWPDNSTGKLQQCTINCNGKAAWQTDRPRAEDLCRRESPDRQRRSMAAAGTWLAGQNSWRLQRNTGMDVARNSDRDSVQDY